MRLSDWEERQLRRYRAWALAGARLSETAVRGMLAFALVVLAGTAGFCLAGVVRHARARRSRGAAY